MAVSREDQQEIWNRQKGKGGYKCVPIHSRPLNPFARIFTKMWGLQGSLEYSTYFHIYSTPKSFGWHFLAFFRLDYWIVLCYKGTGCSVPEGHTSLVCWIWKLTHFLCLLFLGKRKKQPEGRKHGNDIFPSVGSPSPRAISCDMRDNMISVVFTHSSGLIYCDIYQN